MNWWDDFCLAFGIKRWRPMTKINFAFMDDITGEPVYFFFDEHEEKLYLASSARARFRVEVTGKPRVKPS